MKPIGYLPGLRCAFTDGLRIQAAAVSADDFDGGMVPQPPGCIIDAAVVQNVDNRATLEIDHDGPVSCRASPAPVIDANRPDLGGAVSNRGITLQLPQDGVVADRHAEPLHEALARTAARAMAEQADNLHDPCRPARIRGSNRRQSVGERLSFTFLMCASPAAQQEPHRHSLTLDRKVLKAAAGPPMPISASPSAIGANADRWSGSGNNPTVIISELDAQNFDPWAGRPF
ncbi:hypothetical protein IQ26_06698 [Mesorhizobium tianshanense]|uniref:Uncharacterized protein n=1 Tax=Mesorhizobium tianshanense TaxID=39844 RepID=A0A562MQQ9_9HYPH|nr:hypothetical protein IQ26_06698 [Mesorhizobium tianshanense]